MRFRLLIKCAVPIQICILCLMNIQSCYRSASSLSEKYKTDSFFSNSEEIVNTFQNTIDCYSSKNEVTRVLYQGDSLYFKNKQMFLKIHYRAGEDTLFPCNGIAVKEYAKRVSYKTYYIYQDSLLLLPVFGINRRIDLIIVNVYTGRYYTPFINNTFLTTYLTWFAFDATKGKIITANQLETDANVLIHIWKIRNQNMYHVKSLRKQIKFDIYSDENLMKNFVESII